MTSLLVADSFLLDDGRARGLDLHRERFLASCADAGIDASAFWLDAVARLPRGGRWFPRVELSADRELSLRLRPAPPLGGQVRVSRYDGPDPRVAPAVKGPDLDVLGELKALAAKEKQADEVLLTGTGGVVFEAAYSAVLWWEDETLCVPPADLPVLASVTVRLLRSIAAERGVRVAERRRTLDDLAGREAWLANALHGIRPVAAWIDGPPAGPIHHAPTWQLALRNTTHPI
ncbi:aminotransferase class IV [Kribbella deserti]|uniref:Aminotransferase class IV n=1 Tax=Kribbella deserti TaxID=1926257 RepID=A0ABV6QTM1_9ACTN